MAGKYGKYRPVPRDDATAKPRDEGRSRTAQLYVAIIGVFFVAMMLASRAPTVDVDAPTPQIPHRGHVRRPPSSGTATASELGFEAAQAIAEDAPSFSSPSFSAPSFDAPSPDAARPTPPTPPTPLTPPTPPPASASKATAEARRSANPYIAKYVTQDLRDYWDTMEAARKQHSEHIIESFGSWAPDTKMCHGCWTEDRAQTTTGHHHVVIEGACECDGHKWDNQTNWDMGRRKFCDGLNAELEKEHPFPEELKYVLELSYKNGLTETGDMKVPYRALDSGPPSGELPFDPVKVKDHFMRLRAALTLYYQGEHIIEDLIRPPPSDPKYRDVIKAIAAKFAAAFVNGDPIVVGTIGDSTVAGADNCFWDAWPNGLQRQLAPFFGAGKVDFTVRNGGHNGGFGMAAQVACAGSIIGKDADFLVQSSPFVHPDQGDAVFEDMVRRAILSGVIVNIADGAERFWETYAKWGFTNGGRSEGKPYGYQWFPTLGKSGWGRIGDGLCHVGGTRSGSAAVFSRNWHPGPLGHQSDQDSRVFLWADAAIQALDDVIAGLEETGGKIGPLKHRWQKRPPVSAADLPMAIVCNQKKDGHHESPYKQLCAADSPVHNGWPVCYTSLQPQGTPGSSWKNVVITDGAPAWDGDTPAHSITHDGPKSPLPKALEGVCRNTEECKVIYESRLGTVEPLRSTEACTHQDFEDQLKLDTGYTSIRFPQGALKVGTISICGECSDKESPEVMLQADGVAKTKLRFDWDRNTEWNFGDPKCGTVIETLDARALGGDVFIGVKCAAGGMVRYVFGQ